MSLPLTRQGLVQHNTLNTPRTLGVSHLLASTSCFWPTENAATNTWSLCGGRDDPIQLEAVSFVAVSAICSVHQTRVVHKYSAARQCLAAKWARFEMVQCLRRGEIFVKVATHQYTHHFNRNRDFRKQFPSLGRLACGSRLRPSEPGAKGRVCLSPRTQGSTSKEGLISPGR